MSSFRTAAVPLSCVCKSLSDLPTISSFLDLSDHPINARHKLNPSVNSALEIQDWKFTNYCHLKLQQ